MISRLAAVLTAVMLSVCFLTAAAPKASCDDDLQKELAEKAEAIALLVNEARAEAGLEPLYYVPYLCDIAAVRAEECVGNFGHTRPDGQKFSSVIDKSIVPCLSSAENIAAGYSSPENTFNQWKNSEKHWASIISTKYTHFGIGVCYDPDSEHGWYWSQIFVECSGEIKGQYLPVKYKIVPACCGDLNGDGFVDIFDYILMKKALSGSIYLNDLQLESADCMQDGALTIADAVVLMRYITGAYPTLPFVL